MKSAFLYGALLTFVLFASLLFTSSPSLSSSARSPLFSMLICCPRLLAFEVYLFGVRMLPLPWRRRRTIEGHRHRLCISTWVARFVLFLFRIRHWNNGNI
ncbi:hypothetical protein C8J56DRAFT_506333 [Mycena floridula]|nr:hypothetical protein C8J56DRAFT_506333 [Mycena floridula]